MSFQDIRIGSNQFIYETLNKDGLKKTGLDDSIFTGIEENDVSELTEDELLSVLYQHESVLKAIDTNGDGKISSEEKEKFENFIKGYDSDADSLSESDILRSFYDIVSDEFSYDADLENKAVEFDSILPEKSSEIKDLFFNSDDMLKSNDYKNCTNMFSQSCFGSSGGASSSTSYLDNMTLSELEDEKTLKQGEVNQSREDINDVYSGENEAVKEAETAYDEAKTAYDEAIENDEKVTEELKQKREENLEAIENKENTIDTLKSNINTKEGEISSQESVIASDEANISELKSQLSALNSQSSDDPEQQAAIAAQKAQIQAQINQAEQKLSQDKQKLDELNGQLNELQAQLEPEEAALQKLQAEKQEINTEINKNCSDETRKALAAFNEADRNVDNVKQSELRKAQSNLNASETILDAVNKKINEKKVIVSDEEWQYVASNNIDLSEKLENGEPRYVLAQGNGDNKYHVYDMAKNKSLTKTEIGNNNMYDFTRTNDDCSGNKVCYMDECGNFCEFNACYSTASPLSFDINGDGVQTSDEIIDYDIDGDGIVDRINNSADAVLVFDKDGDGISGEDGSECFGNNTDLDGDNVKDGYKDGFEALKELAKQNNLINGEDDNVLDEKDIKYLEENFGFKIKLDGYDSEAVSLSKAGITEINLADTEETTLIDNFDGQGNQLMKQQGATFTVNGEKREYADIWHKKIA